MNSGDHLSGRTDPPSPAGSHADPQRRTAWALLLLAAVFEVLFAVSLKATAGFSRPLPSFFTVVTVAIAILLLSKALKVLDAAVGYTVWTGLGTVGAVVLGAALFDEGMSVGKALFLTLIIAGVLGLQHSASVTSTRE